jgi:hypothetical protein
LEDILGLPEWAKKVVDLCTGPQYISYRFVKQRLLKKGIRTDDVKDVVESNSGILMGLPLTWISLSLIHLFWVHQSARLLPSLQPFAICGDDLIGVWTTDMVSRYEDTVAKCGGSFSKGKHFSSKRFGVFTEECFEMRCEKETRIVTRQRRRWYNKFYVGEGDRRVMAAKFKLKTPAVTIRRRKLTEYKYFFKGFSSAFPIKGLVGRPRHMPHSTDLAPWWYVIGIASSAVIEASRPTRQFVVPAVLEYCHRGLYSQARAFGFCYPTLPREFGGFGLPGRNKKEVSCRCLPRKIRQSLFGLIFRNNGVYNPDMDPVDPWALQGASEARMMAQYDLADEWPTVLKNIGTTIRVRKGRVPPAKHIPMRQNLKEYYQGELCSASTQMESLIGITVAPQLSMMPNQVAKNSLANLLKNRKNLAVKRSRSYSQLVSIFKTVYDRFEMFARVFRPADRWEKLLQKDLPGRKMDQKGLGEQSREQQCRLYEPALFIELSRNARES